MSPNSLAIIKRPSFLLHEQNCTDALSGWGFSYIGREEEKVKTEKKFKQLNKFTCIDVYNLWIQTCWIFLTESLIHSLALYAVQKNKTEWVVQVGFSPPFQGKEREIQILNSREVMFYLFLFIPATRQTFLELIVPQSNMFMPSSFDYVPMYFRVYCKAFCLILHRSRQNHHATVMRLWQEFWAHTFTALLKPTPSIPS